MANNTFLQAYNAIPIDERKKYSRSVKFAKPIPTAAEAKAAKAAQTIPTASTITDAEKSRLKELRKSLTQRGRSDRFDQSVENQGLLTMTGEQAAALAESQINPANRKTEKTISKTDPDFVEYKALAEKAKASGEKAFLPDNPYRDTYGKAIAERSFGYVPVALENIGNYVMAAGGRIGKTMTKLNPLVSKEKKAEAAAFLDKKIGETLENTPVTDAYQENVVDKYYAKGISNFGLDVAQGVGGMIPAIAASVATQNPTVGLAAMGLSAAGGASSEAKKAGATNDKALLVGTISGAIEVATEKLFGAIPGLPKGWLDDVIGKAVGSGAGSAVIKQAIEILGEGAEEWVSSALEPYVKSIYDEALQQKSFSEKWKDNQANRLQSALLGIATAVVLNAGASVVNVGADTTEPTAVKQEIAKEPTIPEQVQNVVPEIIPEKIDPQVIPQAEQTVPRAIPEAQQTVPNNTTNQTDVLVNSMAGALSGTEQPTQQTENQVTTQPSSDVINTTPISDESIETANKKLSGVIDDKIANVMTSMKTVKPTLREKVSFATDVFKRKFVDTGTAVSRIGKVTGDSDLYAFFNNAKQSGAAALATMTVAQTDTHGKVVGKSLNDILEPVQAKGEQYTKDFYSYLLHVHNVDRMSLNSRFGIDNKPVFGENVTAEQSLLEAGALLAKHPEFSELAKDVYKYNDNLLQLRVDAGRISQEQAELVRARYPHYVPTYRNVAAKSGVGGTNKAAAVKAGLVSAKGSNLDILPLDVNMARLTSQAISAAKANIFGTRLLYNVMNNSEELAGVVRGVEKQSTEEFDPDAETNDDLKNTFSIYRNGEKITLQVNDSLMEAINDLRYRGNPDVKAFALLKKANNLFKSLITKYSPKFLITNPLKDLGDAAVYSTDLPRLIKNLPRAYKEILTKGKYWQIYESMGGVGSSYFEQTEGLPKRHNKLQQYTLDKIEAANLVVEQSTRLAEFISVMEKGDGSYAATQRALLAAADVTVNFGRSGSWGRVINTYMVPFFNPSVQGSSKVIRAFTTNVGSKQWSRLVLKAAVLGIVPQIINQLMYKDDEDYEKLSDYTKDAFYLFKVDDDNFAKIPIGRLLSVIGSGMRRLTDRVVSGDTAAFEGYGKYIIDQLAPNSPITNTLAQPVIDVGNNKTWYGGDIESQYMQTQKPENRYDESTDVASRWIGGLLKYSPAKINYLIDAYFGAAADFTLPVLTPEAERNPMLAAFVVDSTLNNRLASDFYSTKEDIDTDDESIGITAVQSYFNKQSRAASDVYKTIREVQNSDKTDKQKREEVRDLKEILNGIQANAIADVGVYQTKAAELAKTYDDPDELYRETNKAVFGAEYALQTYSKDIYAKAQSAKTMGVSYDDYYSMYFSLKDLADSDTKRKAIMSSSLTPAQKSYLDTQLVGERKQKVDYTNDDTFILSQMSESAQKKWKHASDWGLSLSQYTKYYDAYYRDTDRSGSSTKAEGIANLINAGMDESQANYFYKKIIQGSTKSSEKQKEAALKWGLSENQYAKYYNVYLTGGSTQNIIAGLMKEGMTEEQAKYFYNLIS